MGMAKSRKENGFLHELRRGYRRNEKLAREIAELVLDDKTIGVTLSLSYKKKLIADNRRKILIALHEAFDRGWCGALNWRDSPEFDRLHKQLQRSAKIVDEIFSQKTDNKEYFP